MTIRFPLDFTLAFSVPLLIGVVLGVVFPSVAISMIFIANTLLFALMYLNGLLIKWPTFIPFLRHQKKSLLIFLSAIYIFFPIVLIYALDLVVLDSSYVFGFAVSCVAPTAFVAPYFIKIHRRAPDFGIAAILASTLTFPVILLLIVRGFPSEGSYLPSVHLFGLLIAVHVLPLILSIGTTFLLPRVTEVLAARVSTMNSLLLALLMFVLCGSTIHKMRWSLFWSQDIAVVIFFMLVMDFGLYFFCRWLGRVYLWGDDADAFAISISLRNLALPAGLLLQFHTKAAIVPFTGLLVHVFFFQFLSLRAQRLKR